MSATTLDTLLVKFAYEDRQVQEGIKRTESKIESFASNATKSFAVIAAAWGAVTALNGVKDVIVKFEKLEASLRTVTGSSAAAEKAFNRLQEFAKTTPFQLDEVIDSFIKMKALGLDPSAKALASYGNTATAMGKSLNQMIEAVADASTGEFERLKEFGIKSSSEGDKVSFTFQGVTTTIRKSASEIESYLQSIGNVQFAGAMEEQADSLGVALSNMEASFESLAKELGDAGLTEILTQTTNAVTALTNATAENIPTIKSWVTKVLEIVPSAVPVLSFLDSMNEKMELNNSIFQKNIELAEKKANISSNTLDNAPTPVLRNEKDANAAAEEEQRKKEKLANELDILEQHLMSKEQLEEEHFQRKSEILRKAEKEYGLISGPERVELEKELLRQKNEELLQIEEEKNQKKLDLLTSAQRDLEKQNQLTLDRMKAFEGANSKDRLKLGVGMMQDLLGEAAKHNKTLFELNKAAGIANAVVYTALGVSRAFGELPFPASLIAAGTIAAAGAAQIATIASTSFSKGGSGGGGGATASAPSISTESGSNGLDEQSSRTTNVSISGISNDDLFSGRQLRDLIGKLNEQADDGVLIKGLSVS